MTKHIKQNIIKNVIVLIIAVFMWPILSNSLIQIQPEQANNFLLTISTLLVTVCFANFAFTYEKSKLKSKLGNLLSHFAVGIFMLLLALFLESIVMVMGAMYPFFHIMIFSFSILLYIGVVLYDFWDILRSEA